MEEVCIKLQYTRMARRAHVNGRSGHIVRHRFIETPHVLQLLHGSIHLVHMRANAIVYVNVRRDERLVQSAEWDEPLQWCP